MPPWSREHQHVSSKIPRTAQLYMGAPQQGAEETRMTLFSIHYTRCTDLLSRECHAPGDIALRSRFLDAGSVGLN
eukprot:759490-Hanusia_phi.AAC.6